MARLMEKSPVGERVSGCGGGGMRKLSFKTRAPQSERRNYRTTKVTVPSSSVAELASRFNAVIVEEDRGRELLRRLQGPTPQKDEGAVRAAVKAFETQHHHQSNGPRPKVVLVRKQSFIDKPEPPLKPEVTPLTKENPPPQSKPPKPMIHPKPDSATLERQSSLSFKGSKSTRPCRLERDRTVKEKKLSIPKDHTLLDSVLNECPEPECAEPEKQESVISKPLRPESVWLEHKKQELVSEELQSAELESEKFESETVETDQLESEKLKIPEKVVYARPESTKPKPEILEPVRPESVRPNNSFLWRPKIDLPEENTTTADLEDNGNKNEDRYDGREASDEKENLCRNDTPDSPAIPSKSIRANPSSLYRNRENSKSAEVLRDIVENVHPPRPVQPVKPLPPRPPDDGDSYEDINGWQMVSRQHVNGSPRREEANNYEDVGNDENNYAVISDYDSDEAIYDDVVNLKKATISDDNSESYYECINPVGNDSDSSWDQSNSLYGARPSSRASSVSGAVISGASRSDTSDDWVDVESEEINGERQEEIVLVQERTRTRTTTTGWSQKVRRQWSKRAADMEQGDSDSDKLYEAVENLDDDSAVCDDFDDSSDTASSCDNEYKPKKQTKNGRSGSSHSDGIYGFMLQYGKKVGKSSWIGKSLRRFSKISQTTQNSENGEYSNENLSRGRWPSLKKFNKGKSTSTFYLKDESDVEFSELKSTKPAQKTEPNTTETRRLSRPSSPPPPPPPMRPNDTKKKKPINDTTWYSECGLFDGSGSINGELKRTGTSSISWYCDIGLYENRPSDTASEHSSSQGSDLNLRFADEPLYQFYVANVAEMECNEYDSGSDCYEEIGVNGSDKLNIQRPSVLDLPTTDVHRSLWSQVSQVVSSGILGELSSAQHKLQEAKFELVTSEASYYKSLTVLEKHFASSPSMKDETVLPKMDYKILFSNVAPVRKCSEVVLAALDKCWQDNIMLDGVCELIYQLSQQNFNVYIKYCTNQVLIESTLKKLKHNNTSFAEALATLEKSKKCQSLSLYSFLLLPMQRITRMPLLLDAIRTKLEPGSSEYGSCTLALAQLQKIAFECNEAARKAERYEEMALLSRAMNYPSGLRPLPLLSASRWLERSGQVTHINMEAKLTFSRKLTSRNIKLMLFLFTDYLIIAKKKGEDNYSVVDYCARNLVQVSKIDDAISSRFLIVLTMLENHEGKTQEMMLCCGTDSSRERWLQAFASPHSSNSDETLYADWDCPQVAATHAYSSAQPDELTLQHGDVVNVLRKLSDGWYYGERIRDGERGWFPGNHTTEIASMHVRAKNLKLRYRLLALSGDYLQQLKNKNNS